MNENAKSDDEGLEPRQENEAGPEGSDTGSGAIGPARPAFEQLLKDVVSGAFGFDEVMVWSFARLSRQNDERSF